MDATRTYRIEREQWLARPIAEVFAFFGDATNLEAITPQWLRFSVITPAPDRDGRRHPDRIRAALAPHAVAVDDPHRGLGTALPIRRFTAAWALSPLAPHAHLRDANGGGHGFATKSAINSLWAGSE